MEGVAGMPVLHSTAQPVMALLPPLRLTMQRPRDSWLGSADRHAPLTEHVGCMVVAVRQACLPMQAGAAATATRLAATFPDVPAAKWVRTLFRCSVHCTIGHFCYFLFLLLS